MPRTRRLAVAAAALIAIALPGAAHAAPIGVTTTADDANPSACSLRQAVESANSDTAVGGCAAGSGSDVVTLPAGTYTLTHHGAKDNLATGGAGDLDVMGGLTIQGAGALTTIVDGDAADRVFDFVSGTSELRDLTVRNGRTPDGGAGAPASPAGNDSVGGSGESAAGSAADKGDGGGIRNVATLTLTRVAVTGNQAGAGGTGTDGGAATHTPGGPGGASVGGTGGAGGNGGGIANDQSGALTVVDSVLSGNVAGSGGKGGAGGEAGDGSAGFNGGAGLGAGGGRGGHGGGIYQEDAVPAPSLSVSGSIVSGNSAGTGGAGGAGGIGGAGATGASGGQTGGGPGGSGGSGGGIDVEGGSGLEVSDTAIADNAAYDGGVGGAGGTGGAKGSGTAAGDTAGGSGGAAGDGGGLHTLAAANSIDRVAVIRNSTGYGGAGGAGGTGGAGGGDTSAGDGRDGGTGGGVFLGGPTQKFASSTIASNGAAGSGDAGATGTGTGTNTAGAGGNGGSAGGVEIDASAGTVTLTHLTIASNFVGAGVMAGTIGGVNHSGAANPTVLQNTIVANDNNGRECGGTNTDGGHNISFPDPSSYCSATSHVDPLLGPLADNGGPTPTMQLLPGSPALDAAGTGFPCSATDQRGVTRPKGTACDIGAVELSVPTAITGGANSIRPRQASVAGTVDPGGIRTTYFFRFGRTNAYGSKTPTANAGTGEANVIALATLRGLTPNATYHYRLVVTNPDGTVAGRDRTFTSARLAFPGVGILTAATTVRDSLARITVACPGPQSVLGRCTGPLSLKARVKTNGATRTLKLGTTSFSIQPAGSKLVKVKLSQAGRALLRAKGKLTATATARAADGRHGTPKLSTRKVTLNAP